MILILDDERRFIEAYVESLEFEGMDAYVVSERESFFAKLDSEAVKAVVIDIMLPGSIDGGFEVFNELRMKRPDLPVVLFTNRTDIITDNIENSYTKVFQKFDLFPWELSEILRRMIKA